jgi:hypothetical protein
MVEPVTGLVIFAGSWLAKKLARDWASEKKSKQVEGFKADSAEHNAIHEKCVALQEKARDSMGRIGIQRIESMRRVLPHAVGAARLCEEKGFEASAFKGNGWFGGRSQKSLLGLSASLIAVDLVLPEDSPVTAAETLLSTLAAQGAYSAFETLPHHEGIDAASMIVGHSDLNDALLQGVEAVEGGVGKVDDFFSGQDAARDAATLAGSLHVGAIDSLSAGAAGAVGEGVTSVAAEVGGAMDTLGDFIGDFVGPAGWALSGWTLGGMLHASKKLAGKREEVRIATAQLEERTERAGRIVVRGEQLEKLGAEASYRAFKHAWIVKQVSRRRFRGKAGRERDRKRVALLEKSAREYWQVMNAPLLAEGGDAADTPLMAA